MDVISSALCQAVMMQENAQAAKGIRGDLNVVKSAPVIAISMTLAGGATQEAEYAQIASSLVGERIFVRMSVHRVAMSSVRFLPATEITGLVFHVETVCGGRTFAKRLVLPAVTLTAQSRSVTGTTELVPVVKVAFGAICAKILAPMVVIDIARFRFALEATGRVLVATMDFGVVFAKNRAPVGVMVTLLRPFATK